MSPGATETKTPEAKARELMRDVLSASDFRTYEELGFISVPGRGDPALQQ